MLLACHFSLDQNPLEILTKVAIFVLVIATPFLSVFFFAIFFFFFTNSWINPQWIFHSVNRFLFFYRRHFSVRVNKFYRHKRYIAVVSIHNSPITFYPSIDALSIYVKCLCIKWMNEKKKDERTLGS